MVLASRSVRQLVVFARVRRSPALRSTRLPSRIVLRGWEWEEITMDAVPSRFGRPTERPLTSTQHVISRRAAIGGGLAGLGGLLLFPGQLLASAVSGNSFVVLLKGRYRPVVRGPNLGLSSVNLSDGSYSTVPIYPVRGTPGNKNLNKAVGTFYVQFAGNRCAYHVPGGSFAMRFTGSDAHFEPDGEGGRFLVGTFELDVIEGTGIYRRFVGGHNQMVDRLHFLAPGDGSGGFEEYCFCNVSRA